MTRKSSIRRLPADIRELIGRLHEGGRTLDEIRAKLGELDVDVSRSALGRHVKQLNQVMAEVERSRAVAEAMVARFGDAPESRQAQLNIELGHALIMKLFVGEEGEPVTLDAKEAMFVASAIQKLTAAKKTDQDATMALRREIAKQAAEKAGESARAAGLTADQVAALKREVLGIAA